MSSITLTDEQRAQIASDMDQQIEMLSADLRAELFVTIQLTPETCHFCVEK